MSDLDGLFDAHMAIGLALDYPGDDWSERLDAIEQVTLAESVAIPLRRFLEVAREWGPVRLREHYVATFDNKRRCNLYMTYFNMGDTRRRGAALVNFSTLYRAVGYEPDDKELPDYLPLLLELSARSRDLLVSEVLAAVLPGIEITRQALNRFNSPYAHVLDALKATLPSLTEDQRAHVMSLITQGPPNELVGLSDTQLPVFAKGQLPVFAKGLS
ncbi:MAG: nitrate reductase molybdenum cofactor assembly chaperone [Actinomycetaceae bacterium]|nr:nitrate reductase molybdenum cofactor assembly chaperone [Actinomycetaceae bacterium]